MRITSIGHLADKKTEPRGSVFFYHSDTLLSFLLIIITV